MKKIAAKPLVLIGLLTFSLSCLGQQSDSLNKSKEVKSIRQIKTEPTSSETISVNSNNVQTVSNGERRKVLTTEEKIEILEGHIDAIDVKVDHVNSNNELKSKAIEDNWFEEMQAIREELVTELNALKSE